MATATPTSVHFVGSVCLPTSSAVFKRLADAFPPHYLRSIPDGEPGSRGNFVWFQREVFARCPFVLLNPDFSPNNSVEPGPSAPPIVLSPLTYDDAAIESYAEFQKLRQRGLIESGVRFQVSLPTPTNVIAVTITPKWRQIVEPIYVTAFNACLRRIQDSIPAEDLSIQIDMSSEFAFMEQVNRAPAWFHPIEDGLIERVLAVISQLDDGPKLGLHLCYGDFKHKHFKEPLDATVLVSFANSVVEQSPKKISWIHMPVPKDRKDAAYFKPLGRLKAPDSEIILGLVHMNDIDGTQERIKVASGYLSTFGIATECGLGRASQEELNSVITVFRQIMGLE